MSDPEGFGHRCRACELWKTRSDFYADAKSPTGVKRECKLCQTLRQRAQYRSNDSGYADYHRAKAAAQKADGYRSPRSGRKAVRYERGDT